MADNIIKGQLPSQMPVASEVLSPSAHTTTDHTAVTGVKDVQTFNSTGSWNKPAFGTVALIECWGAGGSGARRITGYSYGSGGGGGGGYQAALLPLAQLPSSVTATVGGGGAAVSGSGGVGNAGANSTFGSYLTAYGGGGGYTDTGAGAGGGGGGGGHGVENYNSSPSFRLLEKAYPNTTPYNYTVVGGTLAVDGDYLEFWAVASTGATALSVSFAGTTIHTGSSSVAAVRAIRGAVIRVSATTARTWVQEVYEGGDWPDVSNTAVTASLDFATDEVLSIAKTSGVILDVAIYVASSKKATVGGQASTGGAAGSGSAGAGGTASTIGGNGTFGGGGGGGGGNSSNAGANGGTSVSGGGGGGGATGGGVTYGSGGASTNGGNGGNAQHETGVSGSQPGGGGGGANTTSSGAGGDGRVRVTVW